MSFEITYTYSQKVKLMKGYVIVNGGFSPFLWSFPS